MRLAIIGKYGQLAQAAQACAKIKKIKHVSFSRKEFPMQKALSFERLDEFRPTHLLIASAYTFVDKAEEEQGLALAINSFSVGKLSEWCIRNSVKLVYPSTDYVFDGNAGNYRFSDKVNPVNFYGKTKMLGEVEAQRVPGSIIARTSWLYGIGPNHFPEKIIQAARRRKRINVVNDQIGSPTHVFDFSERIFELIKMDAEGIFHVSSQGHVSWFDFASRILELKSIETEIKPISTESLGLAAKRPKKSILIEDRWESLGLKKMPHWEYSLKNLYLQYSFND